MNTPNKHNIQYWLNVLYKCKYYFIAVPLSFVFFEGLIGDDHYTVLKFIWQWQANEFNSNFTDYINKHHPYEWTHRSLWISHDYIIISVINNLLHLFNILLVDFLKSIIL